MGARGVPSPGPGGASPTSGFELSLHCLNARRGSSPIFVLLRSLTTGKLVWKLCCSAVSTKGEGTMEEVSQTQVTFSVHSSFAKLLTFASTKSLMRLANHDDFVRVLHEKDPDDTESYAMLIDTVIDMLHDFFNLDSVQRRRVEDALKHRPMTLRELVHEHEAMQDGKTMDAGRPFATTLTGSYPVQPGRGRTADVTVGDEGARARAASTPPGLVNKRERERPEVITPVSDVVSITAGMAAGTPKYTEVLDVHGDLPAPAPVRAGAQGDNPFGLPPGVSEYTPNLQNLPPFSLLLDPWCYCNSRTPTVQIQFSPDDPHMPGICLPADAPVLPRDHTIQNPGLLRQLLVRPRISVLSSKFSRSFFSTQRRSDNSPSLMKSSPCTVMHTRLLVW